LSAARSLGARRNIRQQSEPRQIGSGPGSAPTRRPAREAGAGGRGPRRSERFPLRLELKPGPQKIFRDDSGGVPRAARRAGRRTPGGLRERPEIRPASASPSAPGGPRRAGHGPESDVDHPSHERAGGRQRCRREPPLAPGAQSSRLPRRSRDQTETRPIHVAPRAVLGASRTQSSRSPAGAARGRDGG